MNPKDVIDRLQARVDAQMGRELSTPIACTPGELKLLLDLARAAPAKEAA